MLKLISRNTLWLFIVVALLLLFNQSSKAQFGFLDTIPASLHHKPRFLIDLGSYNSIVSDQPALFTDLSVGLSYNKRLYFETGVSTLNTDIISEQVVPNGAATTITNAQLHMLLFIFSAEYVFWNDYPWTFSVIPLYTGIGSAYYTYISEPDKKLLRINEHTLVTYQPQITASYKILKWIGIGGSVGYRFTPFSPAAISKDLDSYTYSFGVKLYLDPIYKAIFPHGVFGKKEAAEEAK